MKKLRLILGDQLNANHSWFQEVNPDTIYCFFEMRQETDYVQHHIQKSFKVEYRTYKDFALTSLLVVFLAFVPLDHVETAF